MSKILHNQITTHPRGQVEEDDVIAELGERPIRQIARKAKKPVLPVVYLTPIQRQKIIRGYADVKSVLKEIEARPVALPESQMWLLTASVGMLEMLMLSNAGKSAPDNSKFKKDQI